MCRNARRTLRLIILTLAFPTFGGLLSGCLTCFGACDALPNATKMVAYSGDDGAIYFNIPAGINYRRSELVGITIYRVDVGHAIPYWGVSKRGYTDQGKPASEGQDLPWPLRYGQTGPLTEINSQPKAIENGTYRIEGAVWLYNEKGKEFFDLFGHFRYENGVVHDYSID